MAVNVQIEVDGDPKTAETIAYDGQPDYWPVRFAVDAFITKHSLTLDEKITVLFAGEKQRWTVRARQLNAVGKQPSLLYFGELVKP